MAEDYSPTIRDAARRLVLTGQHVQRLGNLTKGLLSKVGPPPKTTQPDIKASDPKGKSRYIDGKMVAGWIADIVVWARANGWGGKVTSGVRTVAEQRVACRNLCGNPEGCPGTCAKPGTSNHQGSVFPEGAVDVTDYDNFGRIVARYPGAHTIKNDLPLDRVHFSYTGH